MKKHPILHIILVAAVIALNGCVSTSPILPQVEKVNKPELNREMTSELGETIISKGNVYTYDGIELKNRLRWGDGFILKRFTLEPGKLIAREQDKTWIFYFSEEFKVYDALLGENRTSGGLKLRKTGGDSPKLFQSGVGRGFEPNPKPIYEKMKVISTKENSFKQELIYNGRVGDSLKFLYRELSNDIMRPAFAQEIQYDFKESPLIGFKGARVEVVEASNQKIRYRVLTSFPD